MTGVSYATTSSFGAVASRPPPRHMHAILRPWENRRATYWRDIQEEQSSKLADHMSNITITITGPAPVSAKSSFN
jgi:hypothetical protein